MTNDCYQDRTRPTFLGIERILGHVRSCCCWRILVLVGGVAGGGVGGVADGFVWTMIANFNDLRTCLG
jgi:hypothetical protein